MSTNDNVCFRISSIDWKVLYVETGKNLYMSQYCLEIARGIFSDAFYFALKDAKFRAFEPQKNKGWIKFSYKTIPSNSIFSTKLSHKRKHFSFTKLLLGSMFYGFEL